MKKVLIVFCVLLLLSGCGAKNEASADGYIEKKSETVADPEIKLNVTKEGSDLIIHTVFPERYQKTDKVIKDGETVETTAVPVGVIRFYSYDSDNIDSELEKYAYVSLAGLDTVLQLKGVVGETAFMDMSNSDGKLHYYFTVNENGFSHDVAYGKKEVITTTGNCIDDIPDFRIGEEYLLGYVITSSKRLRANTLDLEDLINRSVVSNSDVYYKVTAVTLEWTDGDVNSTIGWRY